MCIIKYILIYVFVSTNQELSYRVPGGERLIHFAHCRPSIGTELRDTVFFFSGASRERHFEKSGSVTGASI